MATVNAGAAPLDMTNLGILNLRSGQDTIYDANLVRVDDAAGHYDDMEGQFSYNYDSYGYYGGGGSGGSYDPATGTVTHLTEYAGGAMTARLTDLSVDAPTLFNAFRSGDAATTLNLLLGQDDLINGSGGADTLDGWGGNDTIIGGEGGDVIRALEGNDSVDGGAGNDTVNGNLGDDVVHGGDGVDLVSGGKGADTVYGDAGDDGMVNGNIGEDVVHGGLGNDSVFGGQGNDLVLGEEGDDQISGDLGNDTLTGGAGADRFLFRPGSGHDLVTDFHAGEGDRIALPVGTAFTILAAGADTVIDIGGVDQLTVAGVARADFNPAWVLLG
jgi:Ca2+-binding RTX toxin-like protein